MTTLLTPPSPPIVDELTRRQLIAGGLASGFLLTGCGTRGPADGSTPSGRSLSITDDRRVVMLDAEPKRIVTTSEEATELIVALGLKPVGVGSSRVDATKKEVFEDYYLTAKQLGSPTFVGPDPFDFEAITALEPDLIVHYVDDQNVGMFEKIAPTVVYDVTVPGAWQEALRRLGSGVGREQQARDAIDAFTGAVRSAKQELAPVVALAPRISAIYPNYRSGADNLVFGEEFALAAVLPDLGFQLVGLDKAAVVSPGAFGTISTELLGAIDTDTVLAIGPVDWSETASGPILASLDVPVLGVFVDGTRPSSGPLTSAVLLSRYVEALTKHYGS